MRTTALLAGSAAFLAACAGKVVPPSAAAPALRTTIVTPAPPPALPVPSGWEDAALTPGEWIYENDGGASRALYGEQNAPRFTLRCEPTSRRILMTRADAAAGQPMTVRTSFGERTLAQADDAFPAADPLLDDIVSSRGRFAVEAAGLPTLILPTWPEPARVLEDCR